METTDNLGLHLQKYGDNADTWGDYINEDLEKIDEEIAALKTEMSGGRGPVMGSLGARLNVAMYEDGTIKTSEEVKQARLPSSTLKEGLALRSYNWAVHSLNTCPTDVDGIPDFLTYSSSNFNVIVDNNRPVDEPEIYFDIEGYVQIVDADMPADDRTISLPEGQSGDWYLYAERGSDLYPTFGYSSNYGDKEDAVYFADVTTNVDTGSGTNGVTNVNYYRVKRKYESDWRILSSEQGSENPNTITFNHYLGTLPKEVAIFASVAGSTSSVIYPACRENLVLKIGKLSCTIATNPQKPNAVSEGTTFTPPIFYTISGTAVSQETTGYVKIILKY